VWSLAAAVGSGRTTVIGVRIDGRSGYVAQFNALRERAFQAFRRL